MDFESQYTMDVFNEQLVTVSAKTSVIILKIAIIVSAILFTVLVPLFFFSYKYVMAAYFYLVLALWACIIVFWKRFHTEYEYIFTNGMMDFDKVYAKRSRKRIVSIEMEDVLTIAPVNSQQFASDMRAMGDAEQFDCSSNRKDAFTCYIIAMTKSGKVCVLFDPNKKMLTAMRQFKPSLFSKFEF